MARAAAGVGPYAVKGQIVAESYASVAPVSATARRHRLAPSQIFAWRREAKVGRLVVLADDATPFGPLMLEADTPSAAPPPGGGSDDRIEIVVGPVPVCLSSGTPAQQIGSIAAALASAL